MINKDKLSEEIKSIMEEKTIDMTLSHDTINNILNKRKKTIKEKLRIFLNYEIEIPLVSTVATIVILFIIAIIPRGVLRVHNEKIIDMGGSQIIIREGYEVSKK